MTTMPPARGNDQRGQDPAGRGIRLPSFIADLFVSKTARDSLLAGSAALFAAALDPKVWGPSLPSVQAAIRERPELESLVLLAALAGSSLLLLGGAIGDSTRARRIIIGGLVVELAAALVSVLVPSGPVFVASRFVGHGAAAFIIPASLALVATSYQGVARATAIGVAYGAFGAAGALAPILLQVIPGVRAPAFAAAIAACLVAGWLARGRIADLPRTVGPERRYVIGTAIWAFGIITMTVGLTWVGTSWTNPLRIGLIVGGVAVLGLAIAHDRWRSGTMAGQVRIDRRPAAVAVVIGVLLGIAQTAPMMQLPLYFQLVQRFGPLGAVVALVPLFGALVLAGPIAGFLLSRSSPRRLVGAGAVVVGVGNLLLAAAVLSRAEYVLFVVPCLLIGAGFVIATTVRTAIIFASVPRGLPATAAALNEASISVGTPDRDRAGHRDRRRRRGGRVHGQRGRAGGGRCRLGDRRVPGGPGRGRHPVVQPGRRDGRCRGCGPLPGGLRGGRGDRARGERCRRDHRRGRGLGRAGPA